MCECISRGLTNCSCSDDCPNRTSDLTFNGTFNNIPVPDGSTLNDVLGLIEDHINNEVNESVVTYTLLAGNCLSLPAGEYSQNQIIDAIVAQVCSIQAELNILSTDTVPIGDDVSIPACLLPFVGTSTSDLLNHLMTRLCTVIGNVVTNGIAYDKDDYDDDKVPAFGVLVDLHNGYADNHSYVYDHTTVVTSPTSLNIDIQPLRAVVEDYPVKTVAVTTLPLTPNKDIYVTLNFKGSINKIEQTIGNPAPVIPAGNLLIYEIETDGSGVVSYSEVFDTTPFNAPALSIPNNYIQTAMIDNLQITGAKMETIGAGATEGHSSIIEVTYDIKGRITAITSLMSLVGLADGQIIKYDAISGGFINANNLSVGTNGNIPLASGGDFIASSIAETGSQLESTKKVEINTGVMEDDSNAVLNVNGGTFIVPRYTAVNADALVGVVDGTLIYVTTTNVTFTSVGFWGMENTTWTKL
jgi:hypothetical protein